MTIADNPSPVDLEERLVRLELNAAPKPWFRQASVIISIVALVLSLSATVYGEQRAGARDVSTARDRLSGLIARLGALPKENASLASQYAKDPATLSALSSATQTELVVTSLQAADVIAAIPDDVTSAEYYAVGSGLALAGNYVKAQSILDAGLTRDSDPQSLAAIWRTKASIYFGSGDVMHARPAMNEALKVFTSNGADRSELEAAYTEWQWSVGELGTGQCSEAQVHISRALVHLAALPPTSAVENYAKAMGETEGAAEQCAR